MSCNSIPLTSNVDDLYHLLKLYEQNQQQDQPQEIEISIPPTQHSQAITGRYKYSVMDKEGLVFDSGDWKPNLILNCGLDKIAEMSWSNVFQWAVAGIDPTPTKEIYEDTDLKVQLLSSNKCPKAETTGTACFPVASEGGLLIRATNSRREAIDASPLGTCVQRTFGESSDSGKLIYLRDLDLQYNVLTSCPVYAYEPIKPIVKLYADECGEIPDQQNTGTGGWEISLPGQGYIAPLSADTGLPWNLPGGLITEIQSFDLGTGDCTAPVLCSYDATHSLSATGKYVNPAVGVSVPPPTQSSPTISVIADGCSLDGAVVNIMDPGESLGCGDVNIAFSQPSISPIANSCPNIANTATSTNFVSGATGIGTLVNGRLDSVTIPTASAGWGYEVGELVTGFVTSMTPTRDAMVKIRTHTQTGAVTAVEVVDGGSGYSPIVPVELCLPDIPEPDIVSYDLLVDPVETYESVNNGHYHSTVLDLANGPSPSFNADIFNTNQTYLFDQYKTHGWYLTGNNPETNATYCGTDFLSAANQVAMTRTFDFYMELQPVTYTEIGFKESPASRELFSRIALDDPIYLCPGQFLRLTYQLLVTYEPGDVPRYKEVPVDGDWFNGKTKTGQKVLSGYECIQGNGISIVGPDGIAAPYDITGVANEPFAPGSINLGPQYGYVNRWKNGDTRLSWPTKEYDNDSDNPWILGGDQVSPPDWAIKYRESPTVNYMPRDFKTYVEWPAASYPIPDVSNQSAQIKFTSVYIPSGPELPLERDAFDHWFTKAPPGAKSSITFTNFVPNLGKGKGRWDFLITKGYLTDVYPQLMSTGTVFQDARDSNWINTYRFGERVHIGGQAAHSSPGVFPGPVIEYTGRPGSLHDPLSFKGGKQTRNVSAIKHPYTGNYLAFADPVNNGLGEFAQQTITYPKGCGAGSLTLNSPAFCYLQIDPLVRSRVDQDYAWLEERQSYYGFGSVDTATTYPVNSAAGGGVFTKLDSWSPWSHTPLITSVELAYLQGPARKKLRPDTAGNWSQAEAIPVAGSSAFISTNDDDFATYGQWVNRSHTVSGAVTGPGGKPLNDYSTDLSFETPCYFTEKYVLGSGKRIKRAVFETSMANLTAVKCIGIGPTSTTLRPEYMTDAPRFNSYLFKFGESNSIDNDAAYNGFDNLSTYKLTVDFKYVWYRNLKI